MAPNLVHLPNGQTFTVSTVFGGLFFKANDLNVHHAVFPPGWTIIIQSEEYDEQDYDKADDGNSAEEQAPRRHHVHRYRQPTLRNDNLFISSISSPSNSDFKPATSPTRQIAMMLWATLWWYFHQVHPIPWIYACSLMLTLAQVCPEPTFDGRCRFKSPRSWQAERRMAHQHQTGGYLQGKASATEARTNGTDQQ